MQVEGLEEGKQGIIVSTMAELKFFADNGFSDITYVLLFLYSNHYRLGIPFGTHQVKDLESYSKKLDALNVLVDMKEHIDMLEKTDGHYNVFIKIDTGYHRAGLASSSPQPIIELAQYIQQSHTCSFLGLYSHAGHSYDQTTKEAVRRVAQEERDGMVSVRRALEAVGIAVKVVSCGSTPACCLNDSWEGITEIHAGNYCCFDR